MEVLQGKAVFSGIAIGKISILKKEESDIKRKHVEDTAQEIARLENAKTKGIAQLQKL